MLPDADTDGCAFRRSFTIIELLTVVVIIVILMSLLLAGVFAAKEQARKTRCRNDVSQLAQAWNAYLLEYGRFPSNLRCGAYPSNEITSMDSNAVAILRGWPQNPGNPRGVCFMDLGTNTVYFCDPWGVRNTPTGAYMVALDTNLDNFVTIASTGLYICVGVWSDGRDRIFGTLDDVNNWKR